MDPDQTAHREQSDQGPHYLLYMQKMRKQTTLVCLFDMILYIPVNKFSVMSGWIFLG